MSRRVRLIVVIVVYRWLITIWCPPVDILGSQQFLKLLIKVNTGNAGL